jgi:hypothetical protein
VCGWLTLANGSDIASGGVGIGSGFGASVLQHLLIGGGTIAASGSRGAGVGAGCSSTGKSSVTTITIEGGTITANGSSGAGIGAAPGVDPGVVRLVIGRLSACAAGM